MIAHRPLPRIDLRWSLPALAVAAALAVAPVEEAPTICPFALITGTACPGCGLTRAAASLVRGDVGSALAFHPLVFLVLAWMIGATVVWIGRRRGITLPLNPQVVNRLLIASAAIFVVTWMARLTTGTLPPV